MSFTLDDVLRIVALVLAAGGAVFGVVRYLDPKIGAAHRRIDELRGQMVARADLDTHLSRLESLLGKGLTDLRDELRATHGRIDDLMKLLIEERRQ